MKATIVRIAVALLILRGAPLTGQQWRPAIRVDLARNSRTVVGDIKDRELLMATVEFTRPMLTSGRLSVRYVVAATPLAIVASPAKRSQGPDCVDVCPLSGIWSGWDKRYGAGIAPLGLQVEGRLAQSVAITMEAHGGVFWFTRGVPVDGAGRVAFAVDLSAGAVVTIPSLGRIRAGYGFLHLSNAGLAVRNPGLNANPWFLGWSP